MTPESPVLNSEQASALLGIGINRVRQLYRARVLPSLPFGPVRNVRIPRQALLDLINTGWTPPTDQETR